MELTHCVRAVAQLSCVLFARAAATEAAGAAPLAAARELTVRLDAPPTGLECSASGELFVLTAGAVLIFSAREG